MARRDRAPAVAAGMRWLIGHSSTHGGGAPQVPATTAIYAQVLDETAALAAAIPGAA